MFRVFFNRDLAVKAFVLNVFYGVLKSFGKLLEVFLIEEDLMLVIAYCSVRSSVSFAFGDGKIVVLVAFSRFNVKK